MMIVLTQNVGGFWKWNWGLKLEMKESEVWDFVLPRIFEFIYLLARIIGCFRKNSRKTLIPIDDLLTISK